MCCSAPRRAQAQSEPIANASSWTYGQHPLWGRAKPERALKVTARIPLTGIKAAIDKLIAACRPIRRDIADRCGI